MVGANDAEIPAALDDESISIHTLLGGALIQVVTGDDSDTVALQAYRSTSNTLDRETDATGSAITVEPQASYSIALGDTTRENLITSGSMDNASAWDFDADWAVSGGIATHTAGTASTIGQALSATAGKFYRLGFTVSDRTAGSATPRLVGGSGRHGTAVSQSGVFSDRIQAVTGNDTLEFTVDSAFDGSLDDVTAYLETDGCLAQGTHFIWLEPQNADGSPGPVSGPFEISII